MQSSWSPDSKKNSKKVSRICKLYVESGCIFTSQLCGKGSLTGLQQELLNEEPTERRKRIIRSQDPAGIQN